MTKPPGYQISEKASEEMFQALIEGSVQGIYVHDENFRMLFVNEAGAKILGYETVEEVVGMDLFEGFIFPHEREISMEHFQKVISGKPIPNPIEAKFLRKDGVGIWLERIHSRVMWEGKPALLATATDITERKHAEEALRNALSEVKKLKNRLQAENIYLQNEIKLTHNFEEIISVSSALKKALGKVEQVAATGATVLILGETGTGKELFARAVHNISGRRDRPLVKVNCAALPPNLIESELFGHEKGAFTGALARKIGRFELADGGTIFLDEIGDLPLELQVKLLNVLQEGEFERLGNTKTMKVDVRVIAATNRDLQKAIANGDFRKDLFYRLNVFPIAIPPLRERTEDIPFLARHFVKKFCVKMGKEIDTIPERVMSALSAYDWPGNVRELENIIERAVILTSGPALQVEELVDDGNEEAIAKPQTLQEIERQHIRQTLAEYNWKISGANGAAEILGMHPNTLRDRMQKHGLKKPKHRS